MQNLDAKGTPRPLAALLSQVLVAYTIELDDEFELRMARAGFAGARLSLVLWTNVLRFLADRALPVRELSALSLEPLDGLRLELGCLERWGFVVLRPREDRSEGRSQMDPSTPHAARRDGWGSGRGIGKDWTARLTHKGRTAAEVWPPLWREIEERWERRFGAGEVDALRRSLDEIQTRSEFELPWGFPPGLEVAASGSYPPRRPEKEAPPLPLSALLSRVLLMFTIEFDQMSRTPLALCAGILRALGESPVRVGDLPRLTGGSSEASDIGWRLRPYVALDDDPSGRRGRVVRLSPLGLRARRGYRRFSDEIEREWETRFGAAETGALRSALESTLGRTAGGQSLLGLGLVPPQGVARAGTQAPALGRRDVGVAARQRTRDLVEQTKLFLSDPRENLPHYPMWDMNRGFGP